MITPLQSPSPKDMPPGVRPADLSDAIQLAKLGGYSWSAVLMAILLQNLSAAATAALLYLIRHFLPGRSSGLPGIGNLALWAFAALLAGQGLLSLASEAILIRHSLQFTERLRHVLFDHILQLRLSDVMRRSPGDWVSRCQTDLQAIQSGMFGLPQSIIAIPISLAIYLSAIVSISPSLTLWIAVWLCAGILPAWLLRRQLYQFSHSILSKAGSLTSILAETFGHIKAVKALHLENDRRRRMCNWIQTQIDLVWKSRILALTARQGTTLVMVGCFLAMAVIASRRVASGSLSLNDFIAVLIGIVLVIRESQKMVGTAARMQEFRASITRYQETMNLPPEEHGAGHLTGPVQEIALRKVAYSYPGQETQPTLEGVSFTLRRGEMLAIVGLSGGGKTTLLDLLLGLMPPKEGAILINDLPLHALNLNSWRCRLGVVLQDTAPFRGSIRESLESEDWPNQPLPERIAHAIKALGLESVIARRGGMEALMIERGADWSEGEMQRLALVRAWIAQPDVLLLDEPSSALDTHLEQGLLSLLDEDRKSRLTIVVTHRMKLAASADLVLVMNEGRPHELGPPDQVYARDPLFRSLCDGQRVTINCASQE